MKFITEELALILNLRNTAIDHKKHCEHNCNVSIGQLKRTAVYLRNGLSAKGNTEEVIEADKYIAEMPIA